MLQGTGVVANLTACHRDPKYWKNPDKFNPEHFLDGTGKFVENHDGFVPYGIGKRYFVWTWCRVRKSYAKYAKYPIVLLQECCEIAQFMFGHPVCETRLIVLSYIVEDPLRVH